MRKLKHLQRGDASSNTVIHCDTRTSIVPLGSDAPNGLVVMDGLISAIVQGGPGDGSVVFDLPEVLPPYLNGLKDFLGLAPCKFVRKIRKKVTRSGMTKFKTKELAANGWGINGESVYEALHLSRATLEVIGDSLPRFFELFPVEEQLSLFQKSMDWPSERFPKFAKYFTAWPMARLLRQEPPPCPDGFEGNPLVYSGRALRYLRARLVNPKVNVQLWTAWLLGIKTGCAPVSKEFVEQAFRDHCVTLRTPPTNPAPTGDLYQYTQRLLSKFRAPSLNTDQYEGSTSACWQKTRDGVVGGQRGYLRFLAKGCSEGISDSICDESNQLLRMVLVDSCHVQEIRGLNHLTVEELVLFSSLRGDADPALDTALGRLRAECENHTLLRGYKRTWDITIPREAPPGGGEYPLSYERVPSLLKEPTLENLEYWKRVGDDYSPEDPGHSCVKVEKVIEPLKVRLITKGDAASYYASKPLQKGLWGYLQNYPQFSLTGRPLNKVDLIDILHREEKVQLDEEFNGWVSGDYKSATDLLDLRMTTIIFESILDRSDYSDEEKEMLRRVIFKSVLHYPTFYDRKRLDDKAVPLPEEEQVIENPTVQKNGQLMGSPLSFPILCYANIIAYWKSLEEYTSRRFKLQDLPVLVNGDDILFRSNSEHYTIWKRCVGEVGLQLSVGKNYFHSSVLTVNSEFFFHRGGREFEKIPFLNVGLLIGSQTIKERQRTLPLGQQYNQVVHGSKTPTRTHRRFIHYRRSQIETVTTGYNPRTKKLGPGKYNFFYPPELGGFGAEAPEGLSYPPTETPEQVAYASYCFEEQAKSIKANKLPKTGTRIIPDNDIKPINQAVVKRRTTYQLWPKTTPLLENMSELITYEVKPPPLAEIYVGTKDLRVLPPTRKTWIEAQSKRGAYTRRRGCSFVNYRMGTRIVERS